ncbi:hypothetical protein D1007_36268 [Hordeum vulgare]|nr:hypothetical protein D1007_36268 [Hordeum vulgare]
MAETVDSFLSNLLGNAPERPYTLDLHEIGMPRKYLGHLDVDFSKEEVWEAVKAQGLEKATVLDGFTMRLYVACSPIIKEDIMEGLKVFRRLEFRVLTSINQD